MQPMSMKPSLRIFENERIALPLLTHEVGLISAIGITVRVQKMIYERTYLKDIPQPENTAEQASRDQIGPAIALYKELLERMPKPRALKLTGEIVLQAGLKFMERQYGLKSLVSLFDSSSETRNETAHNLSNAFANVDLQWTTCTESKASFEVTHCRIAQLCTQCEVPELTPVFCHLEREFIRQKDDELMLQQPKTIAEGAKTCPFDIYWAIKKSSH